MEKENAMRALLAVMLTAVIAPSVQAQQPDRQIEALVQGNTEVAFSLHKKLVEGDNNAFYSPYSISTALAMTYAGARNNTAAEMKKVLHFDLDAQKLHPAYARLIAEIEGQGKNRPFQLSIANRLWGQKDYGFLKPFLGIAREHYRAPQ